MLIEKQHNKLIFSVNLDEYENKTMFSIIEEAKETILNFL